MRWEKQGLIYAPDGSSSWARSHAMMPTPLMMPDGRIRVYIGSVDKKTVGRIGYVDVDAHNPTKILRVCSQPVLDIGAPGNFDDNGVVPSCILRRGTEIWLYYVGFQLGTEVRYRMFSGLAISQDGGDTFHRKQTSPILAQGAGESLFRTAPWVMPDGDGWVMWYVGGDEFIHSHGKWLPTYLLRRIESPDGIVWPRTGDPMFELGGEDEIGFGRPCVIKGHERIRMLYSIRSRTGAYRLGYAESQDGETWSRRDHCLGLDISNSGWDSQMTCYASVLKSTPETLMFYNGNDYGRTGLGVATLVNGAL